MIGIKKRKCFAAKSLPIAIGIRRECAIKEDLGEPLDLFIENFVILKQPKTDKVNHSRQQRLQTYPPIRTLSVLLNQHQIVIKS